MNEINFNKLFSENLNYYLKLRNKNQSELARAIGVSTATTTNWCSGKKNPRMDKVDKICDFLNIRRSDLITSDTNYEKTPSKGVRIPVLGRVVAGVPVEAIEDIIDYEEITPDLASQGEFFALQIKGDSMSPRMQDGDVVIIKQQSDIECGDIAVVLVNGHDATIKKVKKYEDGSLSLIPTNPTFQPLFFSMNEVVNEPVTIVGRVVELRAKF
ncbi:MAG: helix-turn-helix domain-containing protein [Peptostreptococcaceae bacterium]|nr:helix-turn-helix domain-containing protein [Peptostreptococcaceae bacterium]